MADGDTVDSHRHLFSNILQHIPKDGTKAEFPQSLVKRLCCIFSEGVPFAAPISTLRTNEIEVVRGILQMLQGFSSSLFYWDDKGQSFHSKSGIYLTHLSQASLNGILSQFVYGATCLQLVEIFIKKVQMSSLRSPPTLKAFANSVSAWLKRFRNLALEEEMKMVSSSTGTTPSLLGLGNALSSLCSGAEHLLQIVYGAIPGAYLDLELSLPAAEMAVHILDHLYKKLNEVCLVQGGEEEAYHMLLYLLVGSLLPYIEGLDSWLYDGTLDDPFEELFFYANNAIAINHISQAEFWERSYLLRSQSGNFGPGISAMSSGNDGESMMNGHKGMSDREPNLASSLIRGKDRSFVDLEVCPLFVKDIAKAIVSAGKSLQLIRHTPREYASLSGSSDDHEIDAFERSGVGNHISEKHHWTSIGGLTLSEVFCVSLVGLIGDGSHVSKIFGQPDPRKPNITQLLESYMYKKKLPEDNGDTTEASMCSENIWYKFLIDGISQKGIISPVSSMKDSGCFQEINEGNITGKSIGHPLSQLYCPENPVITVCRTFLNNNKASWDELDISRNYHLPPLNDESLRDAIFGGISGIPPALKETDYMFGFPFGESEYNRSEDDIKTLEVLYPFPTLLPPFQEELDISELLPFQKNSTLSSRILNWIQGVEPKATPLPVVIMQECLVVYIKKQVDYVGKHVLLKLMNGWGLMDELGVLRAIFLLGSGDLLQQFLTVLFDKLDKGESWVDEFELNGVLQESIRNSADGMLLSAPDSLVVSITKEHVSDGNEQNTTSSLVSKGRNQCFGIDALDLLNFTYKVSWPLELIANSEAIKKYNQVMSFLLKVKRAKFVLDKARRWMWKGRGTSTVNRKHHWLVEQKLLHFVDAFHQYVMDRVFHSAWLELCEGMASAGSLDEVIEVHEAYLLSIQRQCFVVPDKLWALIASRIKSILRLALEFYSIQQTLSSGGAALAIKARCEMEVDRIEKQFDDCIAFLLRVLSFKLNVGHFPHLADLVTRINYNYFYMSDSGNLLTVPGSETAASKLGKAFQVRATT
ncbi:Spc97/Spc98 [Macleaya cordata]|uniref:Gamma-tubulin complex component n=1 Tax=Macleaya cordata TaxID=56857 RepID=A0A200R615_MACCD|nr:Spc97/Spc98 [Macleaya cordata]